MVPVAIKPHIDQVKETLNEHNLLILTYSLHQEEYMKRKLRLYLTKLHKANKVIPADLEWINAQYNKAIIALPARFSNQKVFMNK